MTSITQSHLNGARGVLWGRPLPAQPHPTSACCSALVGGRKTGRGFYTYGDSREAAPSGVAVEGVSERILAMLMNEAADAVFGKSDPRKPLIWPCKKASITPKVSWLGSMNGAFRKSSTCWNLYGNDTAKSATGCPRCCGTWLGPNRRSSAEGTCPPTDAGDVM